MALKLDPVVEERWLRMAPIKVGLLGLEMERFEREVRMAFDEAQERGLIDRRYELLIEREAGLPQGSAKSGIDAYRRLVDEGCLAVIGANYTDSAWALVDAVNEAEVPLLSMCGTDRFYGEYCFRVGNGDLGGDPALICSWLRNEGHLRAAVLAPWSPVAEDYNSFFRQECRRQGITITGIETTTNATTKDELAEKFALLRDGRPDALVWLGYGGLVVSDTVRPALDAIGWDPPRIMTTAFMQYIWGFGQLEGWVGIDQWCPDNPRMHLFHQRFVERFDEDPWMWPNAIPGLVYDMAAAVAEGIHRAPILTGKGVKTGLERIRFMPAVTGGPNTHIAAGPWDHQMFKGDWLHYGRVKDGKLEFAGLFSPTDRY